MSRAAIAALLWAIPIFAQELFDPQALMQVRRISDPQLSPDGKTVAFVVQRIDLENNRRPLHIYTVPLGLGEPRQITQEGETNERPRWSPDSKQIAFVSDRSGTPQVWLMNADGSNPRQVTRISTGASGVLFSPDGKRLVFTSEVYPDCPDDACNQRRLEEEKASKIRARVYDSLLYRHWNRWRTARRKHLFVILTDGSGLRDLTPGNRDVPPFSLGGPDDYDISPDGQEVCFVMNADPEPAVSTNSDLYVVPITGGDPVKVTVNAGADQSPKYSPDGRFLAYRTQLRAGYESDRWRLAVMQRATGEARILTENLDRWVNSFAWSPDSSQLFFTLEDRGRQGIQMVPVGGGAARVVASGTSTLDDMQFTPDGKTMVYTERSAARPVEIFRVSSSGGSATALTHLNDRLLSQYELTPPEEFWTAGAEQAQVHSFLLKPPGFQPNRKYPVLMLIHGGPQSAWGHNWSYRWNAQVFAGWGYVVAWHNFHGSSGFGQDFTDSINPDRISKPYEDTIKAAEWFAAQPWIDAGRMVAGGGSYGGFLASTLLGREHPFKALIAHAAVYNEFTQYGADYGASQRRHFEFWEDPESFARYSPHTYAAGFSTPTLVTHGQLDYRVPVNQGLELFSALQNRGVRSRMIY